MEELSIPFEVLLYRHLKTHDDILGYLSAALNECTDTEDPQDFFVDSFLQTMKAQGGIERYASVMGNGLIEDYQMLLENKILRLLVLKRFAHSLQSTVHVHEGYLPTEDAEVTVWPLEGLPYIKDVIKKLNNALDNYADDPASLKEFGIEVNSVLETCGGVNYVCTTTGLSQETVAKVCSAQTDIDFLDFLDILKALGLDIVLSKV